MEYICLTNKFEYVQLLQLVTFVYKKYWDFYSRLTYLNLSLAAIFIRFFIILTNGRELHRSPRMTLFFFSSLFISYNRCSFYPSCSYKGESLANFNTRRTLVSIFLDGSFWHKRWTSPTYAIDFFKIFFSK